MTDERRADIMCAVYTALCDRGYADLTMQDIADECALSKGALHYHYDTKHDLLLAFLDHLYGRFTDRLATATAEAADDPAVRLVALVDATLFPPKRDDVREFRTAMLEIKAQAPYEPAYRDTLAEFDAFVHDRVEALVAEGIDRGQYDDAVEPADVASFVVTTINGAHTRCVATGEPVDATRRALIEYLSALETDRGGRADAAAADGAVVGDEEATTR